MSFWSLVFMQGFDVESKTSEISSSSTLWQDLEAPYIQVMQWSKLDSKKPGTKPEKMTNSEDLSRKVLNLAGQGATSNSERNWWQGPTCRKGKDLEDSGTDTTRMRQATGPGWAQAGRPGPFQGPVAPSPFDLATIRAIYSPGSRATDRSIRHRPPRSREERDTIPERRGSS
jgi:hypothetical protein